MKKDDIPGFSGKPWPQYQEEIQGFIKLLLAEGCRSYLEIGCRYGDTLHAVGLALPKGSRLVALDLPGSKSGQLKKGGHQDSGEYLERACADLRKQGRDAHCILANSQDPSAVKAVKALGPFDAILIDGDHTAEGVTKDWGNYGPMGRLVAFHDIAGTGKWAKQIRPIWESVRGDKWEEFIHDGLRRGIGVTWR